MTGSTFLLALNIPGGSRSARRGQRPQSPLTPRNSEVVQ
ncbi:hypothetical protein SAMN05444414_108105 [Roseovarius marisflavi]|uniref:Uncharacterized protein n=1 Tax=Roseovarius marisflavi TaxID=1054996 RepID=A0A1M6Z022_9RHOB|nr:hypothetical protein SAMN05444414_108105 [Roseovarius marisflavi]